MRNVTQQLDVNDIDGTTQFLSADSWLLSHCDREFMGLDVGDSIVVGYEDRLVLYEVVDILDFYAMEPNNPRSMFASNGNIYTPGDIHAIVGEYLVLQTCWERDGIKNVARRFVLAKEVEGEVR